MKVARAIPGELPASRGEVCLRCYEMSLTQGDEVPIRGGKGGAHSITGKHFEIASDLVTALAKDADITVRGDVVLYEGKPVGHLYKKGKLYSELLAERGVRWEERISKRLYPDEAILALHSNTLTIVEKKYQQCNGSVDEKLQTCDFKLRQYRALMKGTGIDVQYAYLLNDWFKKPTYRDVLAYIRTVGCEYFFDRLPMAYLGLVGD
jgi:hypothetical protein